MQASFRMPRDQVLHLSDAAPGAMARAPVKPVVEQTLADFLASSRAQDRIVVLFAGHAAEIENDVFLVPLEGDLEVKETLIPLDWLFQKLGECKARQKLLVLDVCRYHPARRRER